jgi:hypothetical protein
VVAPVSLLGNLAAYVLVVLAACSLISGSALVVAWVWGLASRKKPAPFVECEGAVMGCVRPRGHEGTHVNADGTMWSWT